MTDLSDTALTELLRPIADEVKRTFPTMIVGVEAKPYTDWSGGAAIRVKVILVDKPGVPAADGGELYKLAEVEPIKALAYKLTQPFQRITYVTFAIESEVKAIEAGTYYAD